MKKTEKVIFKDELLDFKGTIEELAKLVDFDCSLTCLNIQFAKWKQSKLEEAKEVKSELKSEVKSEKEVKTKVKKSKSKKKDEV